MNDDHSPQRDGHVWRSPLLRFFVAFLVFLLLGRTFESFTDQRQLTAAANIQQHWIDALSAMSPLGVANIFIAQIQKVTCPEDMLERLEGTMRGSNCMSTTSLALPFVGLDLTIIEILHSGSLFFLLQLFLGGLAVAALSKVRFRDNSRIFIFEGLGVCLIPLAVLAAATLLAFALQTLMLVALNALHWVTGLAAAAAGATGVFGFCWYCLTKLGEQTSDHLLIPRA